MGCVFIPFAEVWNLPTPCEPVSGVLAKVQRPAPRSPSEEALVLAFADVHGVNTPTRSRLYLTDGGSEQRCTRSRPLDSAKCSLETVPEGRALPSYSSPCHSGRCAQCFWSAPCTSCTMGSTWCGAPAWPGLRRPGRAIRLPQCPPPAEPFPRGPCRRPWHTA